jgi:hypothetical protein
MGQFLMIIRPPNGSVFGDIQQDGIYKTIRCRCATHFCGSDRIDAHRFNDAYPFGAPSASFALSGLTATLRSAESSQARFSNKVRT